MLCPSAAVYAKEGEPAEREQKQEEAASLSVQADEDGFLIENGYLKKYAGTAEKVIVPEGVTHIAPFAFNGCSMVSIELPASLTVIESSAFNGCSSLTSIELPAGVRKIMDNVFGYCQSLMNINVAQGNETYKSYEGCLYNYAGDRLICCPGGKKDVNFLGSLTDIGDYAFESCTKFNSIKLPSGVTSIGRSAFFGCNKLAGIELPAKLNSIGERAFVNCSSMVSIELPAGVDSISASMFSGCSNLTEIKLPDGLSNIEAFAFQYCGSLNSIELPVGLTNIDVSAFSGSGLANITVAQGNTAYRSYDGCLYNYAGDKLIRCPSGKEDVIFLKGITSIGEDAFSGCSNLSSIKLPNGVNSIGFSAFSGCKNLNSIELPNGMDSIGDFAFSYCSSLTSIELPSSLTSIGKKVFDACNSLIIYGETGSYAESYAKENNIPFESIGKPSQPVEKNLSECQISLSEESYVYDGTQKNPAVTVKDGSKVLTQDTDYAIAYKNNINAGKAAVTVTGKGSYTGTVTKTYQIAPKNISKAKSELSKTSYTYDGTAKETAVTIVLDKKQLAQNTDYTITYTNNTNVGTASITVTGKGNYTGTVKASFQITAKSINKAKVELSQSSYTYDGKSKKPAVIVTLDKKKLSGKTDYTVSYANNTKAGTATVTVKGKGNYTGTAKTTFTIKSSNKSKKSISKASVSLKKSSYAYDGKAKKPAVTVKLGKTTLKVNRDYTVSYKGNKNIGKATVTVTGKGNYTGKVSKTFTIAAKKGTIFTVSGNQCKILNAAQVSFTGIKNTKATKAVIPATVKIGGKTFKVTSIAANALKNKAKITSVTVGTNVTSIGSNAFYGCKKLGTVTIKSAKLKTVGKNAFKGIKSTAKIKVPKAKEKAYKKLLKGKGQGKKVKIVRA